MFKDCFSESEITVIEKNLFRTLRENPNILEFLKTLWESNFESIGFKHLATEIFEVISNDISQPDQILITKIEHILQNKDFKRQARQTRKYDYTPRMLFQYELIKNYLSKTKIFLDFGCGKMALIRKICKENEIIEKFYGYDPKSNPETTLFDNRAKFIGNDTELLKLSNIDTVYSSFVFHHLTKKEVAEALENIFKILKKDGRFIFIEESFWEDNREENLNNPIKLLKEINFDIQESTNELFNNLSIKEKFLAIYLNDVLINLKNLSYMPWTFEYRTLENWSELLKSYGFKIKDIYDFGVIDSGRLKQGITSMIICIKE